MRIDLLSRMNGCLWALLAALVLGGCAMKGHVYSPAEVDVLGTKRDGDQTTMFLLFPRERAIRVNSTVEERNDSVEVVFRSPPMATTIGVRHLNFAINNPKNLPIYATDGRERKLIYDPNWDQEVSDE